MRLAVHLGGTDYQKYGADWSEDPEVTFGDFDAFQWMMYWGDRPAMELTAGLILHNFFGRFPEHAGVPLGAGHGVVAVHAAQDGPRVPDGPQGEVGRDGRSTERPSEIFRQHFVVAPFPEENVQRVVAEVGHRADRLRLRLPARRGARAIRRSTSARS